MARKPGKGKLNPNGYPTTYRPKKNSRGTVRFTYRASDGNGGDTATATIKVRPRRG